MKVEILGVGCTKCTQLHKNAEEAIAKEGVSAEPVKVTSLSEIAHYGVMSTPALVIDGTVKTTGKVLSVDEIAQLLS